MILDLGTVCREDWRHLVTFDKFWFSFCLPKIFWQQEWTTFVKVKSSCSRLCRTYTGSIWSTDSRSLPEFTTSMRSATSFGCSIKPSFEGRKICMRNESLSRCAIVQFAEVIPANHSSHSSYIFHICRIWLQRLRFICHSQWNVLQMPSSLTNIKYSTSDIQLWCWFLEWTETSVRTWVYHFYRGSLED
jgi:hypothetical protein